MARSTSTNSTGTEIVRDACARWPSLPSLTLARKLIKQHPLIWQTVDAARAAICRRRGRRLNLRRKNGGVSQVIACTAPRTTRHYAPLPPSDAKPFVPYRLELPHATTRIAVLGDIHLPYHDTAALTAALDTAEKFSPHIIFLNGDTLDFHGVSRFEKNPHARNIKGEIDICRDFLDHLAERFPRVRILWKDGNHDERLNKFICAKAPELYDLREITLPHLLNFAGRGIDYITEKRPVYLGKLPVLHGHEWPTPVLGPVNAARGLFLRAKASAMVSHHHQSSEHTEPTVDDGIITTWSLGCLCDLHPQYAVFNKWNHGAANVEVTASAYSVKNYRIHAGKVLN